VLKLYRTLQKTGKTGQVQSVFYDPGVGTLARPDPWTRLKQDTKAVFGLATGYGLDDNVLSSYRFLIDNYIDGDDIFLFGFSRGAYTVRVLAALIHRVGLLYREQSNLADQGLAAYKQTPLQAQRETAELRRRATSQSEADQALSVDDRAAQFARIASTRWPTIKFMGVWDTVASVIVPDLGKFPFFNLEDLAYSRSNPCVRVFRHAMSIDERRRLFRPLPWDEPQSFTHSRFGNTGEPQDIKQVWFAGVHADIGGGYPEKESAISKYPLIWMIEEAVQHGLAVDRHTVNHLARGEERKGSPFAYVAPDFRKDAHNSLSPAWRILEPLPKSDRYKEWPGRRSFLGHYIPWAEPRNIPEKSFVHESVVRRIGARSDYRPINMPKEYQVVPM
jgi:uncharacterized protein (DUF2235 family)